LTAKHRVDYIFDNPAASYMCKLSDFGIIGDYARTNRKMSILWRRLPYKVRIIRAMPCKVKITKVCKTSRIIGSSEGFS